MRISSFSIYQTITNKTLTPSAAVYAVHFLPSTVVHRHLLLLQLTEPFPNGSAIRYRTLLRLTLTSMDLEQRPDALADVTASIGLDLARRAVLKQALHLGAVRRGAVGFSGKWRHEAVASYEAGYSAAFPSVAPQSSAVADHSQRRLA